MVQSIAFGAAQVYALNLGTLTADLTSWLGVPPGQRGDAAPLFARPIAVPVQSAFIRVSGATVLVDACDPAGLPAIEPVPAGYQPPPDVLAQLAALGIASADISHVVITHLHADHYSGLVQEVSGQRVPCFPQARHYIGRADWDAAQAALSDPATMAHRVLLTLWRAGQIELVDAPQVIVPGVDILPTPGETPGHLALRVQAAGHSFYALGDLYHHPVELARPEWLVRWADPPTTAQSRAAVAMAALATNAILCATHIAGFGRLRAVGGQVQWEVV